MRRIGILGGTFDPIHCGHVDLGHAAQNGLALSELLVLPANLPPHRPQPLASSYHRFAMVSLAIAGLASWRASDLELVAGTRSFTTDTLGELRKRGYAPLELFFIAGADTFAEIESWKDYPAILDRAHFVVVSRPGLAAGTLVERLPHLRQRMVRPSLERVPQRDPMIFLIDTPTADVSSTAIRSRLVEGRSIAGLVPALVQQHIEQHRLYAALPDPPSLGAWSLTPADRLHGQD
jgi:nicotinate-nucleotide adenylyltransferase